MERSGEKWGEVERSGEKWREVEGSGEVCLANRIHLLMLFFHSLAPFLSVCAGDQFGTLEPQHDLEAGGETSLGVVGGNVGRGELYMFQHVSSFYQYCCFI